MKNTMVFYYSNNGSNRYLAQKVADKLGCDIEAIRPRANVFPLQLLLSAAKTSWGIKSLKHDPRAYERIILCGPIWMGKFIAPLRGFINRHLKDIRGLIFLTCCGSGYGIKDDKFGHGTVFKLVKEILGDKCVRCEALPIGLVLPEDRQEDANTVMKTRLSDENFKGEIQERFDSFIEDVQTG